MLFLINSRGYFKAVCAKLPRHSLHTGYILSIEPSSDLPQLFPWCNTICHRFTPSTVRQMVAVKCSQTSGGISSPGYKLNNSEPCLPFLGHKNTHIHTKTSSIFSPLCSGPEGDGAASGTVPACWVAKHSVGKGGSRKLWCVSCIVFIETFTRKPISLRLQRKQLQFHLKRYQCRQSD